MVDLTDLGDVTDVKAPVFFTFSKLATLVMDFTYLIFLSEILGLTASEPVFGDQDLNMFIRFTLTKGFTSDIILLL